MFVLAGDVGSNISNISASEVSPCVKGAGVGDRDGQGMGHPDVLMVGSLVWAVLDAGDLAGGGDSFGAGGRLDGHRLEHLQGSFIFRFNCYLSAEDI